MANYKTVIVSTVPKGFTFEKEKKWVVTKFFSYRFRQEYNVWIQVVHWPKCMLSQDLMKNNSSNVS